MGLCFGGRRLGRGEFSRDFCWGWVEWRLFAKREPIVEMKIRATDGGDGKGGLEVLIFWMLDEESFGGEANLLVLFRSDGGERGAMGGSFAIFDFSKIDDGRLRGWR